MIKKLIARCFGKKEEDKKSYDWDTPRNAALKRIHDRANAEDFVDLAELIPEFIREYGALSFDDKYVAVCIYCHSEKDFYGTVEFVGSVKVFDSKDPLVRRFCVELCAGKKPDVADYKRRYDLQQSLKQACGNGDVLLFDKLLEEGADINYRYASGIKHIYASDIKYIYDNLGSTTTTLWDIVQKFYSKQSPMYRYFMTRTECTGVQEFLEEEKKEEEKAKAVEDLIASRTAQQ